MKSIHSILLGIGMFLFVSKKKPKNKETPTAQTALRPTQPKTESKPPPLRTSPPVIRPTGEVPKKKAPPLPPSTIRPQKEKALPAPPPKKTPTEADVVPPKEPVDPSKYQEILNDLLEEKRLLPSEIANDLAHKNDLVSVLDEMKRAKKNQKPFRYNPDSAPLSPQELEDDIAETEDELRATQRGLSAKVKRLTEVDPLISKYKKLIKGQHAPEAKESF